MLSEVTGITRVCKLYLELLYRCNFSCLHCFHGEKLLRSDSFTIEEASSLIKHFADDYKLQNVTLLGGEPFLHRDFVAIAHVVKGHGLMLDVCTNGYRIGKKLAIAAPLIDHLRVSLEGMPEANDAVRKQGSFREATETLRMARELRIQSSVTMTINAHNVGDLLPLALYLQPLGVTQIKLHCLRPLGNAACHPELLVQDPAAYQRLHADVSEATRLTGIPILLDEDLTTNDGPVVGTRATDELDRIEVQPNGDLYISCKAVGSNANAFHFDKITGQIVYRPSSGDEISLQIPQVKYAALR